ncbi:MAG: acyl dehydratase [Chloroflexota bacterium]|nr:acyl dehydratase [Chloroflexota bacterium]
MALPLAELLKLDPDKMPAHSERPTPDEFRHKKQVYYEDVQIGQEIPKYIQRFNTVHLFNWCAAIENPHRIHYDHPYAINYDKLPGVLFHGTWRMAIIPSWLKDWTFPGGWFWKADWQVRAMVVANEITIVWGKVTNKYAKDGLGFVDLEIGIKNQDGIEGCPGNATVVLPLKGGKPIPYPFVPPN